MDGLKFPLNFTSGASSGKYLTTRFIRGGLTKMITFTGTVSSQAAAGESVTITITKPNSGGTATVLATTSGSGSFSATYTDIAGVGYSAVASVAADSTYAAATSPSVSFIIGLIARTVTLTVG